MKCTNCGAEVEQTEAVGVCSYCGKRMQTEPASLSPSPAQLRDVRVVLESHNTAQPAGGGRAVGVILLVVLASIGVAMFFGISSAIRCQQKRVRSATKKATTPKVSRLSQSQLAKAPKGSWFSIDRRGIQGGLDAFDPIANYAWAESWALSWSADSRLERISIANVRHDGRGPDVTKGGKGDAGYRFYSPSRHAAAQKLREVSDERVLDGLRLWLSDGRVMAMITRIDKGGPKPSFGCDLKNLIKAARSAPRAKRRPYYNLRLMFHKSWSWSVKPRGRGRSVRVHADSCKVGR